MMKQGEQLGTPGQGMIPQKVLNFRSGKGRSRKATFKQMLDHMKIVRADYILVLQFDPERDAWLVHNFEQATLDLTF